MFRTLFVALYLIASYSAIAQYSDSAPKQLDLLAQKIKNSEGISISFNIKMQELGKDEVIDSDNGSLLLKDEAYVLALDGTTTYSDGKNQWIFLEEEQEVTIQEVDEEEITAANIFTQYQEGFRFRTLKEDNKTSVIELMPTDKSSPYLRITMNIDRQHQKLLALVIQSRNATLTEIKVNSWLEKTLSDKDFTFDQNQHPNVDVIDLR